MVLPFSDPGNKRCFDSGLVGRSLTSALTLYHDILWPPQVDLTSSPRRVGEFDQSQTSVDSAAEALVGIRV